MRIGHEFLVEGYPPVSFDPEDNLPRNAHDDGIGRNITNYHGIGAYPRVVSYLHRAQDLRPGAHHDVVADGRMPLPFLPGGSPKGDAVIHGHVVAHLAGLTDHDAHAVVDEKSLADLGPGMYLDTGQKPCHVGDETSEEVSLAQPEPMGEPVEQKRVESRVGKEDLGNAPCCRVPFEDCPHIFTHS